VRSSTSEQEITATYEQVQDVLIYKVSNSYGLSSFSRKMKVLSICSLLAFVSAAKCEHIVEILIKTGDSPGDGMDPIDGTGDTGLITLQVTFVVD